MHLIAFFFVCAKRCVVYIIYFIAKGVKSMKKFAAFFSALVLIIISVFADISASAATYTPDVTLYSKAYMLINMDDDSYPVVAEKNQDEKMYPASLTKIVTAMVTIENVQDLQQEVTKRSPLSNCFI